MAQFVHWKALVCFQRNPGQSIMLVMIPDQMTQGPKMTSLQKRFFIVLLMNTPINTRQ